MTRVRVESFSISLDGYGAGPGQDIDHPLGVGGTDLHRWAFPTRTFQKALFGADGGTTGIDDEFAARGFILTHHARPSIETEGGSVFHFVTGCIHEALDRAREAAAGLDIRIGGGPNTIQQYLRAGLVDELHVAMTPVLLGGGERLFEDVDLRGLGYECVQFAASDHATHVVLRRPGSTDV